MEQIFQLLGDAEVQIVLKTLGLIRNLLSNAEVLCYNCTASRLLCLCMVRGMCTVLVICVNADYKLNYVT
jgi:hypothetical protein